VNGYTRHKEAVYTHTQTHPCAHHMAHLHAGQNEMNIKEINTCSQHTLWYKTLK